MSLTASPPTRVAVVDAPGLAGVMCAHRALGEGRDVVLLGEGADAAHEVVLKARAERLGLLVLGPGSAGAVLHDLALGHLCTVRPGPVAVVGASGAAVREVAALVDRAGAGVSACHVLGPRDLTAEVGAAGLRASLARLRSDGRTRALVAVLWPGDRTGVERGLELVAGAGVPAVVVGAPSATAASGGLRPVATLEAAAHEAVRVVGGEPVEPGAPRPRWVAGGHVRGLFTGGALCAEAAGILRRRLGEVGGDPVRPGDAPDDDDAGHLCLDLGHPARRGALPHPARDPRVRLDALRRVLREPRVRVVVMDLVLGPTAHPDPVGAHSDVLRELAQARPQLTVVAHVVGTESDPQGLASQEAALARLGVRVAPSNAAAARLAAALVTP